MSSPDKPFFTQSLFNDYDPVTQDQGLIDAVGHKQDAAVCYLLHPQDPFCICSLW